MISTQGREAQNKHIDAVVETAAGLHENLRSNR